MNFTEKELSRKEKAFDKAQGMITKIRQLKKSIEYLSLNNPIEFEFQTFKLGFRLSGDRQEKARNFILELAKKELQHLENELCELTI